MSDAAKPLIPLFRVHMPESVMEPLKKVLMSGYIGQGPKVEEFEKALAKWTGNSNVLSVNAGTSALHLAMRLAGVDHGTELLTSPMTCTASNMPALERGAGLVWADIDPWTGNIDPVDVERKITSKTRAILAIHWGGYPCEIDELKAVAKKYGLPLIEDAAHAFGATYKGKLIGSHSDLVAFSFQAIKHLTSVTPDTRVLVRRNGVVGVPQIGSLDQSVIGQECASFDQSGSVKWGRITGFIKHPIDDVIVDIKTEKGRLVSVTKSHSLFTFDGQKFIPKLAGEIKVGDWLAMPRRLPISGDKVERIDLVELLKDIPLMVKNDRVRMGYEGRGANAGKWTDRYIKVTPQLCRMLGYYAAEGSVANWSRNGKRNAKTNLVVFSFGAHEENTHVQDLINCLEFVFPDIKAQKYRTRHPDTGMKVMFGSSLFAHIIVKLNAGVGAINKRIPDLIWGATDECKLAFVEAMVNGDGHRRVLKDQMEHENLTSISSELITGYHYLLLTMGIQTSMEVRPAKGTNREAYVATMINRRAFGFQKNCRENCVPSEFVNRAEQKKISVPMYRIISENSDCPPQLLKDVCLLRVSSLSERPYKGDVYDFCVDGLENFIGGYGGYCLHNTVDGGILTCRTPENYRRGKLLRWFGIDRETPRTDLRCEENIFEHGHKFHMSDVSAVIGLEQLKYIDGILGRHRANAAFYRERLANIKGVRLLKYQPDRVSAYWLFTIRVRDRDGFQRFMDGKGVMVSRVHVRNDVHTYTKAFRRNLPGVDEFDAEQVSIPVGWWVTDQDREKVVQSIEAWSAL